MLSERVKSVTNSVCLRVCVFGALCGPSRVGSPAWKIVRYVYSVISIIIESIGFLHSNISSRTEKE